MARDYFDHREIEPAAQKKWDEAGIYVTDLADTSKDPYYLLIEFPYPSGDLHVGHWYAFAITDIYARFMRMQGKNVLYPFGFDAFGLPAENAAIKRGLDPMKWTHENMDTMRMQIRSMGPSFDWSKEVVTCSPEYYKWTQWLFSRLFEHNLAERKEAAVKWCPHDQTVLANEQVIDGKCERCGHVVEERLLTQWFLGITKYADRLITDLDALPWREDIKDAQRAWIGKSEGAKLAFALSFEKHPEDNEWRDAEGNPAQLVVFTTRPDTLFGVTYIVVAPEHPWITAALDGEHDVLTNEADVRAYVEATKLKTERERMENKEKTGVQLKGVSAVNPITKELIPIYVADYVIGSYGTGAVMAVPAHDERDAEFAAAFSLPAIDVIDADGALINSAAFDGRDAVEATTDIISAAGGERTTNFRIRDWLVSRQRYWGCPIPVVYDPAGKAHLIPSEHLPWLLPTDVDFAPSGVSPLATSKELKERVEAIFGEGWTPEYDTLDTFVDSSWYFLRYLAPNDDARFSNPDLMKSWLPVDRYSGGSEHTTMHLLYSRFFYKALYDLALVPTPEPFFERYNRGLIMGPDGHKMSKSKGNVVNPDEYVQKYGADAVRTYLAFIGPYNEPGNYPWKPEGVESMRRFLDRAYALRTKVEERDASVDEQKALAKAAAKMKTDIERFKLNKAVSSLMILLNTFEELESISSYSYQNFLRLLAPFAPHLAEHLFVPKEGEEGSIHQKPWPIFDESLLVEDTVVIGVQIAGKRRGEVSLSPSATEEEAVAEALKDPSVQKALPTGHPSKVIYRPGKILNLMP